MKDHQHREGLLTLARSLCCEITPLPTSTSPVLVPLDGIRAVIFDIYGTLLVSGSGDVGTLLSGCAPEAAAAALGAGAIDERLATPEAVPGLLDVHIREAHEEAKQGGVTYPEVEIREIWRSALEDLKAIRVLPHNTEKGAIERVAMAYECGVNPVWPMPGLDMVLSGLRDAGVPLGIVSNAQFYTPLVFEALTGCDLEEAGFLPDLCTWSYLQGQAKPSPALFQPVVNALHARGIEPGEAVYVGNDMLNDIAAARQAGMKAVLFAGDERSLRLREDDERCQDITPDAIITELSQLPELIA